MNRSVTREERIAHRSIIIHDDVASYDGGRRHETILDEDDLRRNASGLARMEAFLTEHVRDPSGFTRRLDPSMVTNRIRITRTRNGATLTMKAGPRDPVWVNDAEGTFSFTLPPPLAEDADDVASTLRDVRIAIHAIDRILRNDHVMSRDAFEAMADLCEEELSLLDRNEDASGTPRFMRHASPWSGALATGPRGTRIGLDGCHWSLRENTPFILMTAESDRAGMRPAERWRTMTPRDPVSIMRTIAAEADDGSSTHANVRRMAASLRTRASGDEE